MFADPALAVDQERYELRIFQTAKLEATPLKGPGVANSFVLDVYDRESGDDTGVWGKHNWRSFEGFDFSQALYVYGAEIGLGYRSHVRTWVIFVAGYQVSVGLYLNKGHNGLFYKEMELQADPFLKVEGTFVIFQGSFTLLLNRNRELYSDWGLGFRF